MTQPLARSVRQFRRGKELYELRQGAIRPRCLVGTGLEGKLIPLPPIVGAMDLLVTPTLTVPEGELRWQAVRSGGPGGQNVNKVATKVELRFRVPESSLPEPVRQRLREKAKSRINADGELVITCDETRSQAQNLTRARQKLVELIRAALIVPRRRRKTRPSLAAVARRLENKARNKAKKAARQSPQD